MGRSARYSDNDIARAVEQSFSIAGVLRLLGIKPAGGSHFHMSKRIARLELDTSHFTGQGHNKGRRNPRKRAEDFLVQRAIGSLRVQAKYLRRSLVEIGRACECEGCGTATEWQGKPLLLHIDHIDGDPLNCLPENLRFLCPNCHSQTSTYCRSTPRQATRSHRLD